MINELTGEDWNIKATETQSFSNIFENKLINIVDQIVPLKEYTTNKKGREVNNRAMRRLINLKRKKVKSWKRTGNITDRNEIKEINKKIKSKFHNERKDQVRREIII